MEDTQDLIAKALAHIAATAKRPELKEVKQTTPPWVFEDNAGKLVVLLTAPDKGWSQQRYYARFGAHGKLLDVQYRAVGTCVAEGTKIDTASGSKPVQDLRLGESIWGFDLKSRRRVLSKVIALRNHTAPGALQIRDLRLTGKHPILAGGSFVPAGDVAATDRLLSSSGKEVSAGEICFIAGPLAVYDITVDGVHNYFADGLLVHNQDRPWWPHVDDGYYVLWPTEKFRPELLAKPED